MLCLNQWHGKNATIYHGDCVEIARQLPPNSIDLSVYSPPFANLYTYSPDARDMGNCADDTAFLDQYRFLADELTRILRPGRNIAVHCCDLPSFKWKHGYIGFRDFPGELIKIHTEAGLVYHSRVTIWKDPVTEMQRTKAHGLLYKTIQGDAGRSRVGNPDYLLIFHKPGNEDDDEVKVTHTPDDFPLDQWQEWASPVWMTVDQQNTLNGRVAREDADERHICPLQLDVIERAIKLYTNPGEVVFSPFGGIGSEGVGALTYGRKFVGVELKDSYFNTAVENLRNADDPPQLSLFGGA